MRVTIDLMKKSTQIIDLSNVINPRVGDDDLSLPLHIVYDDNQTDMRGKDVEFLSNDTNKKRIYVAGTCNTNTPGDNLLMGNLTFRFPAGTFKADGTYDPDKTMFRIVDKETQKVISSVNVKITVMKNNIEFDFDPDKSSYDSRLETMLQDFHDKGQAMLDEIKDLNNQANSNVSGDTATTAKEAKKQADQNAGDISDLKGEVAGARGRFADMAGREDSQDIAINQKESIANANANYAALQQKNAKLEGRQTALSLEYQSKLAQINVNPEFATDINELTAKYPNGKEGVFILNNGHTAIYQNGWQDSGHSITVGSFNYRAFIGITDVTAPYDSLDTLPANSVIFYAPDVTQKFLELPFTDNHVSIAVITAGANFDSQNNYGRVQRLINRYTGNEYYRTVWVGSDGQLKWDNWYSQKGMQELAFTGEPLSDPYDDLNTLPSNTIAFYAPLKSLKNNPLNEAIVVKTEGPNIVTSSNYGETQTVIGQYTGKQKHRTRWIDGSGTGDWSDWHSVDVDQEKGLANISLSIFDKVAVIGDSYSAGWLLKPDGSTFYDRSKYQWSRLIGKKYGFDVNNLSMSGWTAQNFVTNKMDDIAKAGPQDAYIIALGINDQSNGTEALGTKDDLKQNYQDNPDSFYGNMGKIIGTIKANDPNARIILLTIMRNDGTITATFNSAIRDIAGYYNLPVAELDSDPYFKTNEYIQRRAGGHPTIVGYGALAEHLDNVLQKTILNNYNYFCNTASIFDNTVK